MMMLICFCFFSGYFVNANTPNYAIAFDHYAQGQRLPKNDKERLEIAGQIVGNTIKKAEGHNDDGDSKDEEPILDSESFEQLDLIAKNGKGLFYPPEVKKLSYAARAFLTHFSTAQTSDPKVIEKRRSIIEYLQKNPRFKAEIIKIMAEFEKDDEEAFLNLSKELTAEEKEQLNKFFLDRTVGNFSSIISVFGYLSKFHSLYALPKLIIDTGKFFVPAKVSQYVYNKYANICSDYPYFFTASLVGHPIFAYSIGKCLRSEFVSNVYKFVLRSVTGTILRCTGSSEKIPKNWDFGLSTVSSIRKMFEGLFEHFCGEGQLKYYLLGAVFMGLFVELPAYWGLKNDYNTVFAKREKTLIATQRIFSSAQELNELLKNHPEFAKNLQLKNNGLQSITTPSSDLKTAFVLKQFNNQMIKKPSWLNYWFVGSRMVVDKIIYDNPEIVRNSLLPVLAALGEVQAYAVLADQCHGYCAPQLQSNGMQITLDQFFHPNLPNAVANSLDYVVSKDKRFVFVSGPNGSGKSGTVKSILTAVVAGQTAGLIPAQRAKISLFDKIYCIANLSDSLGVASKFQVELGKLKNLHQYLEKNKDKKVLLIVDEPLTTTDSRIAGKILVKFFEFLRLYPQLAIISISNNSTLKNFKDVLHMGMVVEKSEDGTFKPTYKCKEGHAYSSDVMAQFTKIFGQKFAQASESLESNQSSDQVQEN